MTLTLEDFFRFLTQAIFLFIAGSTLLSWLKQREQARLDIALSFVAFGSIFIVQDLQLLFPDLDLTLISSVVTTLALLSQPYLLLRVAGYFRPVPRLIERVALIGLLVIGALNIVMSAASLSQTDALRLVSGLLLVGYVVIVEVYVSSLLVQGALTIPGVTGKRLRFASAGSGFLALIFLVILAFLIPTLLGVSLPENGNLLGLLIQLIVILSGLSYYLGFAPPRWLTRAWQLEELHRFLRQTSGQVVHDRAAAFEQLSQAASRTVGGAVVGVARWDIDDQRLKLAITGGTPLEVEGLATDPGTVGEAWREGGARVARIPAETGPEINQWAKPLNLKALLIVPILSPLRPWGLLIVGLTYLPLFAKDDLDVLTSLAEQSAVALDYASLIDELQVINQSLEQRVAERTAELSKVNRALRTISDCNQELVRAETETELINKICQTIVDTGGYRMAWVGFAEQDEARKIRPAATAGLVDGYFEALNLSWSEAAGLSPMGSAIRTGRVNVVHTATDDSFAHWRDEALRRGYASYIALPLMTGNKAFGGLGIFSASQDAFDEQEVKLLVELANDLAYGISALRTREAHAQAEAALQRSDEFLRQTNRMAKVGGWELDLTTMMVSWSEETYRIHEVDPSVRPDLENAINFYAPEARPIISAAVEKAMADGTSYDLELPFITATGKRLHVRAQGRAEFDNGKCVRLSGTFQDITELRQVEEKLQESEKFYRRLFEHMRETLVIQEVVVDETGKPIDLRFVDVNPAAELILGKTRSQLVGRTRSDVAGRPDPEGVEMAGRVASTGEPFHMIRNSPGTERWFESFTYSLGSRMVASLALDITERKRAEALLQVREEHAQSLLRLSRNLERAQTYADILNAARDEIRTTLGFDALWIYLLTDDRQYFKALVAGGEISEAVSKEENAVLSIKGDRMLEEIAEAKDIVVVEDARTDERTNKEIVERLGNRTIVNVPMILLDKKLGTLGTGTFGNEGVRVLTSIEREFLSALASRAGVTLDRVRVFNERVRAEQQLRQTLVKLEQNNRELQDFAYVASHDLQEPLRKIQSFGDRLVTMSADKLDERSRDYLMRMQAAAARMQTLIDDLLSFSRVTTKAQPFGRTDLNSVLAGVLSDLETRIEKTGGRIETSALPTLEADATQMRQMLQNLLVNALKFHKPDQSPIVSIRSQHVPGDGNWQIIVSDNGIGFDEKYLDRIFVPFQRLHGRDAYEGTGIGLAVVRKIAERHNGSVTANSAPGEGATFIVSLPAEQKTP